MKYKYILAIAILSLSVLMFNGCGKNDAEPVTSEAIEETEPTEEIEEPDEEPEVPENTDTSNKEDNSEENSIAGTGVDSKTDEEIEAELEEIPTEQPNPSTSTDGEYDGRGFNLETGEYDQNHDTNNGQGWDINGKHYETKGDYYDEIFGNLPPVEEEPEWWTPDQGPITQ